MRAILISRSVNVLDWVNAFIPESGARAIQGHELGNCKVCGNQARIVALVQRSRVRSKLPETTVKSIDWMPSLLAQFVDTARRVYGTQQLATPLKKLNRELSS